MKIEKKWLIPRQFKNCVRWVLSDSVLDENFDFENSILDVRPDSVHVCKTKNQIIDCLDSAVDITDQIQSIESTLHS